MHADVALIDQRERQLAQQLEFLIIQRPDERIEFGPGGVSHAGSSPPCIRRRDREAIPGYGAEYFLRELLGPGTVQPFLPLSP